MADLQDLANPYDFANPVADGDLFIGRREELSEIKYYLSQALKARRPTNLALIGNRASGKTSLLNITELEAKKLGLLTVRVDLDEGDASSQWAFFFKIFDCVVSSACESGAFGGRHSQTFDTYVDVTSSLTVPADKTFCPFFFPIQYSKAVGGNNLQGQVPDYSFRCDLETIQREVKRPIIILFDEGDVLSKSRIHLQKLRNIFMNSSGYMLVLTGTPEMFPVMDDVFSPIIRQFRKVALSQFDDQEETEELIRRYLVAAKVHPESLFDFETSNDLEDIHDLTGGRPYEIQLVCHTLFRRVQQGRAQKMSLDLGVIEEVRQQLESSQKLVDRPILSKIRVLDNESLEALSSFFPCVEKATVGQVLALERILGPSKWQGDQLSARFECLKRDNILGENADGVVEFKGDDFDRIYTKYFSAEKAISVQYPEVPFSAYARIRLDLLVRGTAAGVRSIRPIQVSERVLDIRSLVEEMSLEGGPTKVYVETPSSIIRAVYKLLFDNQNESEIALLDASLGILGSDTYAWYVPRKKDDTDAIETVLSLFEGIKARAASVGCSCVVQTVQIPVPSLNSVVSQMLASGNKRLAELLAVYHANTVLENYTSKKASVVMQRHANVASLMREFLPSYALNNLGYYYISQNDMDNARTLLELAMAMNRKAKESFALPAFNLAIANLKMGNRTSALEILKEIAITPEDDQPYCLFVPRKSSSGVTIVEVGDNPNLKNEIQCALAILLGDDDHLSPDIH